MVHRAARDNHEAYGWFAGRAGERRLGAFALGLGVALGLLACVPGLPFDARACAAMASACLNIGIAVTGTRLIVGREAAAPAARVPLWKTLLGLARLAFRRDAAHAAQDSDTNEASKIDEVQSHDRPDLRGLLRALPWQPWAVPFIALVSLGLAALAWARPEPAPAGTQAALLVFVALTLVLAFGALVAERFYAQRSADSRACAALVGLLRVLIVAALGAAAAGAWSVHGEQAPDWLPRAIAVLSGAVAIELAMRSAWAWLAAPAALVSGSAAADDAWFLRSAVAAALRAQAHPLAALDERLRARYGIDLRQNWALQSFVRLLPGTLAAMVLAGWLLGGVTILGPDQRAVYERFGAPVAVWQPGLHVGLPWPFGRARPIDNGAVHQLIVSGSANDTSQAAPPVAADAAPPGQLNRLWDVAHPWETTQVIAGTSGDQQAFQIVSADVRLDYRIGLSDAAARAALYRTVDLDATVRSIANREVVRYLASRTLQSLLDTPQTAMAATLRAAVQRQLDRLVSGIEVVAVVIESVHPPAGAAAAYHGVQAAQIRAQASVVQARGFAAQTIGGAQQQAIEAVAQGSANAADTLAAARVQQAGFDADVIAQGLGGPAFAFEYYLHSLQKGLQSANVTVIDDRLASGSRATLDLRTLTPATAAGVRQAW
ncbi:SPFH domain-containing protein [Paraburkholderia silviterrae]|uniref:Protease modulator HflK n=1 Tax=Paraburkholderia silviterrae TaxID=2528715 RepID=A0A4R5M9R1_9BURK|nr:protease modulator HflK [Paraburkholderia silviterrae]TDG23363.1 protease modulator HflK [Paraburkholderia silviterrae]